jgi:uncharacterized protein (TIGR00369 family)
MPDTTNPPDPDYAARVRASFARQAMMATIGASLAAIEPGQVDITMPFHAGLTQQHGFLHAGVVTALVDTACGFAALSLMPPGTGVLSVEYKVNLLAPAQGARFLARGRVIRAGRTILVCAGDVFTERDGAPVTVATMLATMMVIRDRPGIID